jgi:branched-chain amino acid transport system permease protein
LIEVLVCALVAGVLVGGLYGVVAMGLSLIFGIIRVINFAHGALLMLGMYAGYWLWHFWRIDPYVSILVVVPLAFFCGYGIQHLLIRPMFLREKAYVVEPLGVLLLMAGLDMVLANGALLLFKSDFRAVNIPYGSEAIHLGLLTIPVTRLILLILSLLLASGLTWFLSRTDLGNSIRAVGQNREAAALCGIDVYHIFSLTFGLGLAITAFGGCAMLPFYPVDPNMGLPLAVKSFIVVVLGGLGSIPGALLGGIIIGIVECVGGQFVPATSASIFSLIIFLFIVFFRPKGLMGILEA